jgi:hypothetical protein
MEDLKEQINVEEILSIITNKENGELFLKHINYYIQKKEIKRSPKFKEYRKLYNIPYESLITIQETLKKKREEYKSIKEKYNTIIYIMDALLLNKELQERNKILLEENPRKVSQDDFEDLYDIDEYDKWLEEEENEKYLIDSSFFDYKIMKKYNFHCNSLNYKLLKILLENDLILKNGIIIEKNNYEIYAYTLDDNIYYLSSENQDEYKTKPSKGEEIKIIEEKKINNDTDNRILYNYIFSKIIENRDNYPLKKEAEFSDY